MRNKILSVVLAVCLVCCCLLPAAAANETGVIRVKLHSDIAGLTVDDAEKLVELRSPNVVYRTGAGSPVQISDYAGTAIFDAAVAGRTYYISCTLVAADGYTLPDALSDGDLEIECGKGASVISTQIVSADIRDESGVLVPFRGLMINAEVVADGNIFQRLIGMLHDLVLKIRAWSLF